MAQISGKDITVALYDETAFGVDPALPAAGTKAYFSSLDVKASQESIENPIITGGRGLQRPGRGNIDVTGSFATTLAPNNLTFWFKHILGAPTGAGTNVDPYIYVPKDLPSSFIIEKDYTAKLASKIERFNGCRVKSATIDMPQSGYVNLNIDVLGKRYGIYPTALDSSLTDPQHVAWTGYQGNVKKDGVCIGGVLSASISIDNEMDGSTYCFPIGTDTPGERFSLSEGRAMITGNLELVFQDFTLIEIAQAGTDISFDFTYTSAANDELKLTIDHCEIPLTTPAIDTAAGLKLSFTFNAFASGSDMGLKATYKPHA